MRVLFGTKDVELAPDVLRVEDRLYPIIEQVIVLLPPDRCPPAVRQQLAGWEAARGSEGSFAPDIQATFGDEWQSFPEILPEHADEFAAYTDLLDLDALEEARVFDLGCGIGRWSYFLEPHCRELVLVDFSEAIFVAQRNLAFSDKTLFFMGDLLSLPFQPNSADLVLCLGVLHHLPVNAIEALRLLAPLAPRQLIYLYYALDNRPFYFRLLLACVTVVRLILSRIHQPALRQVCAWLGASLVYQPLVVLGRLLAPLGLSRLVPLYDTYHDRSARRLRQDVYDRLFTRIEQRFSRAQIERLTAGTFGHVTVSDGLPFWHFLCER